MHNKPVDETLYTREAIHYAIIAAGCCMGFGNMYLINLQDQIYSPEHPYSFIVWIHSSRRLSLGFLHDIMMVNARPLSSFPMRIDHIILISHADCWNEAKTVFWINLPGHFKPYIRAVGKSSNVTYQVGKISAWYRSASAWQPDPDSGSQAPACSHRYLRADPQSCVPANRDMSISLV